ncbi:hypothetical protein P692DRAFT_20733251, partial [Suillus brevipes Sb2]
LAEKTLVDCVLKQNVALSKLYRFEASEAERNLEDTDIDIGYVRHSVRKVSSHCPRTLLLLANLKNTIANLLVRLMVMHSAWK